MKWNHQRAPLHQHFFSYRLDFDIASDARDQVVEVDAEPASAESVANPKGEWFVAREHLLPSELKARRQSNPATSRLWRVVAAASTNGAGGYGYALVPGDNTVPLQTASARPRRKAGFLSSQLWVTPYAPEEMNAAGDYPIMPSRRAGFRLVPSGFFGRNPAYGAHAACR